MLHDADRSKIAAATRTMQIIAGAMISGVAFFLLVVLLLTSGDNPPSDSSVVTYISVAVAVALVAAWGVVPPILSARMTNSVASTGAPGEALGGESRPIVPLLNIYQVRLILSFALLEGAAFFALVAYLVEQQTLALATAIALWLILCSQFPLISRIEYWVESQLLALEQPPYER